MTAEIGITLLLFTLGVELSFHRLRGVLKSVVWVAILQIVFGMLILFVVLFGVFGFSYILSLTFAVAGSLSSTVVIIKILFEKGELDSRVGELLTGWLVIQDLAVIPIMVLFPVFSSVHATGLETVGGLVWSLTLQIGKSAMVIALVVFLGKTGIPFLLRRVARWGSREVYLMASISIVFVAALFAYICGLTAGLGAFIAGLLIAETSENHMVFSEVRPLRDVFATVFFVSLGMSIPFSTVLALWPFLLGMTLLALFLKFLTVFFLARFLGHHPKTAWFLALGLLPVSEFAFILAKEGMSRSVLSLEDATLLFSLVILSILFSSPLLANSDKLYYFCKKFLEHNVFRIGKKGAKLPVVQEELPFKDHVVLCGYGRVGKYIGRALEMAGIPFVVVDFNHTTISQIREKGITAVYGDPADRDVLDKAQVDLAKTLIIAIPDRHTQEMIIGHALTLNKSIEIICRTHHEEDQAHLKSLGVHIVIQPEFEASLSIIHHLLPHYGLELDEISGKISRLKIEHGAG